MSQPQPLDPAIVAVLRPAIIQILNNADLSSISAKKVRAQLAQLPPNALPPTLDLSASKKQVDEVIRDCFDQISKGMPAPPQPPTAYNGASSAPPPSGGLALPGLGGVRGGHTAAPTSVASSTTSSKPAPAKSTPAKAPASNGTKPKAESKPKKKPAKKRAAADDDDDDEPRKKRAANPNNPFNRPLILSPKMADVCGGNEVRIPSQTRTPSNVAAEPLALLNVIVC